SVAQILGLFFLPRSWLCKPVYGSAAFGSFANWFRWLWSRFSRGLTCRSFVLGRREVFRSLLRFTARRRLRRRPGIAAPQLLADLLHGVERSCRGGCRFAAGLAAGWIK